MNSSAESLPENTVTIPASGRLLGIDFGTKRVGLAISTPDQTIASPLEIYHRRNVQLDARHFKGVIEDYNVRALVVGLPVHLNGTEGQKAKESRAYGKWLKGLCGLPVDFWDERYTSVVAEEYMLDADLSRDKRKKRIDMVAAQIMLQSYLDRRRNALKESEIVDGKPESRSASDRSPLP